MLLDISGLEQMLEQNYLKQKSRQAFIMDYML